MSVDVIVFDLDGVLVDSLPGLYAAYAAFAHEHGFVPRADEFAALNGPSLSEIVAELRTAHRVAASHAHLLQSYRGHVDRAYERTVPMAHCNAVLQKLRALGLRLALASSAPRTLVDDTLSRFDLARHFEVKVSGDDVSKAKPAPDIYQRVAALMPDVDRFFVVEDSVHGVQAAAAAGMRVVRLVSAGAEAVDGQAFAEARDLPDAVRCILAAREGCSWLASCATIELRVVDEPRMIAPELESAVVALFNERKRIVPGLTDGKLLCYRSHRTIGEALVIEASIASYRMFVAALARPDWRLPIVPLAVSGVAFDVDGHVLMAERHAVAQYVGSLELVPSGGIDERHQHGDTADAVGQLLDEWSEETQLPRDSVRSVRPFGLIRSEDSSFCDVCFRIDLVDSVRVASCSLANEYVRPISGTPLWLLHATRDRPVVPISRALLGIVD